MNDCLQRHLSLVTSAATKEDVFERAARACFQNQPLPENLRGFGGSFWTALAERSGDSAFAG